MTINKEQYQNAYQASMIAKGFLATSELIDKNVHDGFQRLQYYIYPHTVNAAASCELFLKTLLILQTGICPDKHSLVGLYERIDQELKDTISEQYKREKCSMSLGKCLQTYNNSIVEWRYPFDDKYQGKTLTSAWKELIVLDLILRDIVEEQLQASPLYGVDSSEQEEQTNAD